MDTFSGMMKLLKSLTRSAWSLAGLSPRAEEMVSSSSPKKEGTGPASRSPSNRSASRGHALTRKVGMLSLE